MNGIVAEIVNRGGCVSFFEFMDLALYHPEVGYYTKVRTGAGPVGPEGDFITAPTASPLFARTFAQLLNRLAEGLGGELTFVELAAGEGYFLDALRSDLGAKCDAVVGRWIATEAGEWARTRLATRCPAVEVAAGLDSLKPPKGPVILFASELYDVLPVHRVVGQGSGNSPICELYVEASPEGNLQWRKGRPSDPALLSYLKDQDIHLEDGQIAELRPRLCDIHQQHLTWCGQDALAVIVEYGYPKKQLFNARGRRNGSLVGYRHHAVEHDVLQDPGEIDITAHVNFSDLELAAAQSDWKSAPTIPLGLFLAMHGAIEQLPAAVSAGQDLTNQEWQDLQSAKNLLLPTGMGADLKVLIQGRGRPWVAYSKMNETRRWGLRVES